MTFEISRTAYTYGQVTPSYSQDRVLKQQETLGMIALLRALMLVVSVSTPEKILQKLLSEPCTLHECSSDRYNLEAGKPSSVLLAWHS